MSEHEMQRTLIMKFVEDLKKYFAKLRYCI